MGLSCDDLPMLLDAAKQAQPLLPSQSSDLHEIIQHVYFTKWLTELGDKDQSVRSAAREKLMGVTRDDLPPTLLDVVKQASPAASPRNPPDFAKSSSRFISPANPTRNKTPASSA